MPIFEKAEKQQEIRSSQNVRNQESGVQEDVHAETPHGE
jgi:hypothetical protein